ncbi:uncharacterized protein LOC126985922 [Eriocheir sinensis]|uniref:uncharacterized protein LOC126985922 n=1 Tax=Eriocheir sinensis TaxID=95602 RepID=UPI0021C9B437|nr:uncharacterized protein LOC126985922 [Eriocheir sinensis]
MIFRLLVVTVVVLAVVEGRYAPTRDHNTDWKSLISGKQQFKDARILYSLLNNDPELTSLEKREMVGFDSSERVFEGFQHPFYYHQRQQQAPARDPVLFSRLSALTGDVPLSRSALTDFSLNSYHQQAPQAPQAPSHPMKNVV